MDWPFRSCRQGMVGYVDYTQKEQKGQLERRSLQRQPSVENNVHGHCSGGGQLYATDRPERGC